MFPILDEELRRRIRKEILKTMANDNVKGWLLGADGRYQRVVQQEGAALIRSQMVFMGDARSRASVRTPALPSQSLQLKPRLKSNLGKLRRRSKKRRNDD
jgi:hypothetical protein